LGELQATLPKIEEPVAEIKPVVVAQPQPEEPVAQQAIAPEKTIELEAEPEIETAIEPEIPVVPEPELPTPEPELPAPEPVVPAPAPEAQPEPETKQEETAKASLAEVLNADGHSLNEQLAEKAEPSLANILSNSKIEDLRQALSLAERFRFQRELFGGNGEKMNTTLAAINAMKSEAEATDYLSAYRWNDDDECVVAFKQLVHRKFI
jgi:outer membrane biosynthesis protein TonB